MTKKPSDERKYSDPGTYDNSIDHDDAPDGSEGGYTANGTYIPPGAMMELVSLRRQRDALLEALKQIEFATKPEPNDGSSHENAYMLAQVAIKSVEGEK